MGRREDERAAPGLIALERTNEPGPQIHRTPVQLVEDIRRRCQAGDDRSPPKAAEPPGLGFPFGCLDDVGPEAFDGTGDAAQGEHRLRRTVRHPAVVEAEDAYAVLDDLTRLAARDDADLVAVTRERGRDRGRVRPDAPQIVGGRILGRDEHDAHQRWTVILSP